MKAMIFVGNDALPWWVDGLNDGFIVSIGLTDLGRSHHVLGSGDSMQHLGTCVA